MATVSRAKRRAQARSRLAITFRILIAGAIAFVAAAKGLQELEVWKNPSAPLLVGMVVFAALAAFRDSLTSAWSRYNEPKRVGIQADIQQTVVGALVAISLSKKVPLQDLGASVFVIRQGALLPERFRTRSWNSDYLDRILRFRLTDSPQVSDVDWVKGKGAIGKCWAQDHWVHLNAAPIATRWAKSQSMTESDFLSKVKETTRQGFSRQEFFSTVDKYAEILAVPMKDKHGHIMGVLSVDLANTPDRAGKPTVLDDPAVRLIAETAAAVVHRARRTL